MNDDDTKHATIHHLRVERWMMIKFYHIATIKYHINTHYNEDDHKDQL